MKKIPLTEIKTIVHVIFDRKEINEKINEFFLGTVNCNMVDDDGNIIPIKHDNIEIVKTVQNNLAVNFVINLTATLFSDGSISDFQVK